MGGSYIDDAALLALAGKSPHLADLDVSGTHVTPDGLMHLACELTHVLPVTAEAADTGASEGLGDTRRWMDTGVVATGLRSPEQQGLLQQDTEAEPQQQQQQLQQPLQQPPRLALQLTRLQVSRARALASDAGMAAAAQLCAGTLQELVVAHGGGALSDAGLAALVGCDRLTALDIPGSSVTEVGVLSLLPN